MISISSESVGMKGWKVGKIRLYDCLEPLKAVESKILS